MNKRSLSESDICDKPIRPAMERAGWDGLAKLPFSFSSNVDGFVLRNAVVARVHQRRRLCTHLRQRPTARQAAQAHLADALVDPAATA